jgi:hypothetical protein
VILTPANFIQAVEEAEHSGSTSGGRTFCGFRIGSRVAVPFKGGLHEARIAYLPRGGHPALARLVERDTVLPIEDLNKIRAWPGA